MKDKLTPQQLATVFFHTQDLLKLHQEILTELSVNLQDYPKIQIAKLYLDRKDEFEKYKEYALNLPRAQEGLEELHEIREVHNTIKVYF